MPATYAKAPGKIILIGEHAVVFGKPAIAVPVDAFFAKATISPLINGSPGKIRVTSSEIRLDSELSALPDNHPIRIAIQAVHGYLGICNSPAYHLQISSTIPIASGLGSGASVSVAIINAIASFFGQTLPVDAISNLAFQVERIHHGNPSGVDNTVIAYNQPIYFIKGHPVTFLNIGKPLRLVIANSGICSQTSLVIQSVQASKEKNPVMVENIMDEIGSIATDARKTLANGELLEFGELMNNNHKLLQQLGVSCEPIDKLVSAALDAGALGAKLTGAGKGGNIIALVDGENATKVIKALKIQGVISPLLIEISKNQHKELV